MGGRIQEQQNTSEEAGRHTVVSAFAGIGGSSLGYRMAGFRELLAIDWDGCAVKTFKLNFPEVPIWNEDIAKISGDKILDFCEIGQGGLDVLDGSPPCQGFSMVGNRKILDPRNDLTKHFARLVGEIRPKVYIMENVRGMVLGTMKGRFIEVMEILRALDYEVRCKLLNAKYYGVPQSRERLFWIGVRKDLSISPVFPLPSTRLVSARKAIGDLEESEKANRKEVTEGLKRYSMMLKEGENASKYHKKGSLFGLRRISSDRPSPTVIKSAGTGLIHYRYKDHFLSVRELARLCSFPDSFRFIGSRGKQIDGLGNSVMPLQMKAIAEVVSDKILSPYYNKIGENK